jgi:hypothetical protein
MTPRDKLTQWLRENPPESIPYWPGAAVTTPFGFRMQKTILQMGASPLHIGIDRAGGKQFLMPFDGFIEWRLTRNSAGSLLRIVPETTGFEMQVFHTDAGKHQTIIEDRLRQGETMPVVPGTLGLSSGVHTHTEIVFPDHESLREMFAGEKLIVQDRQLDMSAVDGYCATLGLDADPMLIRTAGQVRTWAIDEMGEHYAVRRNLPDYRLPHWGKGATLHVDSMWLFRI